MNEVSAAAPRRAAWRVLVPVLLVLALGLAAWFGWHAWQVQQQQEQSRAREDARQLDGLGQRSEERRVGKECS